MEEGKKREREIERKKRQVQGALLYSPFTGKGCLLGCVAKGFQWPT